MKNLPAGHNYVVAHDLRKLTHTITEIHAGDVYRVPPGTIHAFQGGLKAIEIGHVSDLTYRVFDHWHNDKARALHPDQAKAAINYDQLRGEEFVKFSKTAHDKWDLVRVFPVEAKSRQEGSGAVWSIQTNPDFGIERIEFSGVGEHGNRVIREHAETFETNGPIS